MAMVFITMVWHVRRRAAALAETQELVERERRAQHVKELFVRNCSHEMRTPITVASGYAELLRKELPAGGGATTWTSSSTSSTSSAASPVGCWCSPTPTRRPSSTGQRSTSPPRPADRPTLASDGRPRLGRGGRTGEGRGGRGSARGGPRRPGGERREVHRRRRHRGAALPCRPRARGRRGAGLGDRLRPVSARRRVQPPGGVRPARDRSRAGDRPSRCRRARGHAVHRRAAPGGIAAADRAADTSQRGRARFTAGITDDPAPLPTSSPS